MEFSPSAAFLDEIKDHDGDLEHFKHILAPILLPYGWVDGLLAFQSGLPFIERKDNVSSLFISIALSFYILQKK
jgi:hypothetical protein